MTLLDRLSDKSAWRDFLEYKSSLACPKELVRELKKFIDEESYLPVCRRIAEGADFPLPRKAVISKQHSQKKRVVYTYPPAENMVLKLLTHLLLRRYDGLFSENLYSFRPGRNAKDAIRKLTAIPGIDKLHSYKVDISNYFNSIPIPMLLPKLRAALSDDPALCAFLERLLTEEHIIERGHIAAEEKGIMAGTPISSFLANLYLRELDAWFYARRIPYARYSDDIILFAPTREETEAHAAFIRDYLAGAGLSVNPAKEQFTSPGEGWVFLGFSYKNGIVDIAPVSIQKLKKKMRRKARALARWSERNGIEPDRAAKAFIRIFNRKLLENAADNELTWSYWFFSVINTADGLREIDRYAQDCLRFLLSGKRTKARFSVRYEDMKKLGYRNLVHEYYGYMGAEKESAAQQDEQKT